MITPFPDKASAHSLILMNDLKIILQISRPISHGMGIFAHKIRVFMTPLEILMDFLKIRIHTAVQIQQASVVYPVIRHISGSFIMKQTGVVIRGCPFKRLLKGTAISTLISHRPDHHGRTVLIAFHTPLHPIQSSWYERRIISNQTSPFLHMGIPVVCFFVPLICAVAFIICLVNHIKSILIIKMIILRCIGIMAGADCVYIMFLHQGQIPAHLFL